VIAFYTLLTSLFCVIYDLVLVNQNEVHVTRACACALACLCILIDEISNDVPKLWISTHLNLSWMIHKRFSISLSNSRARACALSIFGIPVYRCSYNLPML
jgi:hypothetical protein